MWTFTGGKEFGVEESTALGFENITFPFLFIAAGFVGAAIFLIFELIIGKKKSNLLILARMARTFKISM